MTKERFVKAVLAVIGFFKPIAWLFSKAVVFCKALVYKTKASNSAYQKSPAFGHLYTVEVTQRLRWYSPFAWTYLAVLACGCLTIGPILGVLYSFVAVWRGLENQHSRPFVIRYTLSASETEIGTRLENVARGASDKYNGLPGIKLLKRVAEYDAVRTVINGGDVHAIGGLGYGF